MFEGNGNFKQVIVLAVLCLVGVFSQTIPPDVELLSVNGQEPSLGRPHSGVGRAVAPQEGGFPFQSSPYRQFDILPHPEAGWRVSAFIVGSNPDNPINGIITFKPWDAAHVLVNVSITGLPPGRHATHFHAFGDLSQGCASTGPHFRSNLIGNLEAKPDGSVNQQFYSPYVRLFGLIGIVGRSVVIHEKESNYDKYPSVYSPPIVQGADDPVSYQRDEDTVGPTLACGIVTITNNVE